MAKLKGQLFARLALDYDDHPKIAVLSDNAFRTHVSMMLYARRHETDGKLARRIVETRWVTESVNELLSNDDDAPSLVRLDSGDYFLYGYADMQETKADIDARRQVAAANGKRGGRPRKLAETQRVTEPVTHPLTQRGTQTKAETETETETYISASQASAKVPDLFPDWWSIWGKKKAKGDAAKAYKAALKIIPHDDLMAKTRTYWEHVRATKTDLMYVPYPASWLRAEQWDDDLTTDTPQQQGAVFDPRQWKV